MAWLPAIEQVLWLDTERGRELAYVYQTYVSLAAFHAADIGAVEASLQRQLLLRKASLLAHVPNKAAESLL
jgi:hypothetical protein